MSSASVTAETLWESYEALKAGDQMVMSGVPPGRLSAAAASCLGGAKQCKAEVDRPAGQRYY